MLLAEEASEVHLSRIASNTIYSNASSMRTSILPQISTFDFFKSFCTEYWGFPILNQYPRHEIASHAWLLSLQLCLYSLEVRSQPLIFNNRVRSLKDRLAPVWIEPIRLTSCVSSFKALQTMLIESQFDSQ